MASIVFEVECECEGKVTRADESVGYPGNEIEDPDLSSVMALKGRRFTDDKGAHRLVWDGYDLLDGLDKAARQIVIENIMKTFATEVDEAILSDA